MSSIWVCEEAENILQYVVSCYYLFIPFVHIILVNLYPTILSNIAAVLVIIPILLGICTFIVKCSVFTCDTNCGRNWLLITCIEVAFGVWFSDES